MSTDPSLVEDIRAASRSMVRELGFMQSTLAASGHSASAVHTLLEIDARGATRRRSSRPSWAWTSPASAACWPS